VTDGVSLSPSSPIPRHVGLWEKASAIGRERVMVLPEARTSNTCGEP
jgi:hypothetical protein